MYTTNNLESCEYIATHSEARVVLAENHDLAGKYFGLLEKGKIDIIVLWDDPEYKHPQFPDKVVSYAQFISAGERVDG